jgi:hypothetical protein
MKSTSCLTRYLSTEYPKIIVLNDKNLKMDIKWNLESERWFEGLTP